jgi:hypothetical protein
MAPVSRLIRVPVEVDFMDPTARIGIAMALPILPILFVLQTAHAQHPMYAHATVAIMVAIAKTGSVIILS